MLMPGLLRSLFAPAEDRADIDRLYNAIVVQARSRAFFADLGVPDTPEGRYALIVLHAFLVMDRLGRAAGQGATSQALFDAMFADMDRNLREMGVGDLSVGRKVKGLVRYFFAMSAACRDGLNRGDAVLRVAVEEYLYGGDAPAPAAVASVCAYLRACESKLEGQAEEDIARGQIRFADLQQGYERWRRG